MKKMMKRYLAVLSAGLVLGGGVNLFASASGNVADTLYHYTPTKPYTEIRYKANASRTYVIVSDGGSVNATVMGANKSQKGYSNACSKECKLTKYVKYTISNTVYGRYNYAVLRLRSGGSGSGYWSPDSTRNYKNVG